MSEEKINIVGINVLAKRRKRGRDSQCARVQRVSRVYGVYYFTILRAHCTGLDGEGLKGVIEDTRLEDLSHFKSCIQRIYELGGSLPNDAMGFVRMSGCEFLQLPTPTNSLTQAKS